MRPDWDVDEVLSKIAAMKMPPVQRQILLSRIRPWPTEKEIESAEYSLGWRDR